MSILQQVIEEYGEFISKTARDLTDKTDKSPSGGSVSEWSELLENKNGELEEHEVPIAIEMVAIMEMRSRGISPDHYTSTTICKHCGPVPIWEGCPPEVIGCPWCFNRHKNLPVPSAAKEASN